MAKPKTDDDALLCARAKEKPELLEADTDSDTVEQLIGRLIKRHQSQSDKKGETWHHQNPSAKAESKTESPNSQKIAGE